MNTNMTRFSKMFILFQSSDINIAACTNAQEVAQEGGTLVCAGINRTFTFLNKGSKEEVQREFREIVEIFIKAKVDFLLAEVRNASLVWPWNLEFIFRQFSCHNAADS